MIGVRMRLILNTGHNQLGIISFFPIAKGLVANSDLRVIIIFVSVKQIYNDQVKLFNEVVSVDSQLYFSVHYGF